MATTIEEIEANIREAVDAGYRERLLARGHARSIIWKDGVLPEDAPPFSPLLSYDLLSYAYSLLALALRLKELEGDGDLCRQAFEQVAGAIEAVYANGDPEDIENGFHHFVAAASYHLGRYSARAYSLLRKIGDDGNFSPTERALSHIMLRNLSQLESLILTWRLEGNGDDDAILAALTQYANREDGAEQADSAILDQIDLALSDNLFRALAIFLTALERGDGELVGRSLERLNVGLEISAELNLLPQWWAHRLSKHLLSDLWSSSFHERLPLAPPEGESAEWTKLRSLYIALLYRRRRAEIDLWPSQYDAAGRALDESDDLVVSLPTSAGKTRIAELCILKCLASGKRIIFVTPLRALSAQTEVALQRTFAPLGKTISTLYGSIGASAYDEDALRERNIIVATPEKLDFALRNEPSLVNDVGLIVLDEGHMIGLGEREVRYEAQIQRLLKRADADARRIVCLSAILPSGDQMDDFVAWLRRDKPGQAVSNTWRPTRLRYGEVIWQGKFGKLNLRVGDERPFVPKFITAFVPPIGKRKKPFPCDQRELCLATAWRLVEDGQSVLIYCPLRASVEPFAETIIDLHKRGALPSVLEADPAILAIAQAIGKEWLGENHPILKCLELGIAIHHGSLPTAFRKEIEKLLRDGVLRITVSSPTLAQGLNLSATALVVHSITRYGEPLNISEFRNVVGRAGRAFIDLEGLVLHPMFDDQANRQAGWEALISNFAGREMESGMLRLVASLLIRISNKIGSRSVGDISEYIANNAKPWAFPKIAGEVAQRAEQEQRQWEQFIAILDTAILSLLGEQEIPDDQIEAKLDEILSSSLWARRLERRPEHQRALFRQALLGRAKYIWGNSTVPQRRGYFLAGMGLEAGKELDEIAEKANLLLIQANAGVLLDDTDAAITAITKLAKLIFKITPFIPDPFPDDWKDLLKAWLLGEPLVDAIEGDEAEGFGFIENGLVYKLSWGMEALRVRALANNDPIGDDGTTLADYELGLAVPAVETGTLNRSAALLVQAGFSSRLAAIKAVVETKATFTTKFELQEWLNSDRVRELTKAGNWPTAETAEMWSDFCASISPLSFMVWSPQEYKADVVLKDEKRPLIAKEPLRLVSHPKDGSTLVLTPDYEQVGTLVQTLNPERIGLAIGSEMDSRTVYIKYYGPEDLPG